MREEKKRGDVMCGFCDGVFTWLNWACCSAAWILITFIQLVLLIPYFVSANISDFLDWFIHRIEDLKEWLTEGIEE